MSLVKDTLRTSTITEELSDAEVEIIEGLFEVQITTRAIKSSSRETSKLTICTFWRMVISK
jgi:hypothetical protein